MPPAASANIARHLSVMARHQPRVAALKVAQGRSSDGRIDYLTLSFAELETEVAAWQAHLRRHGVKRGDRVLVMVRPGLPLIAGVFALFALGAVPVVIDPGMGLRSFLSCVARSRPRALLGIPLARVVSRLFRAPFRSLEVRVPVSARATARVTPPPGAPRPLEIVASAENDLAAVLFTSGSTGAPKGVCYEHRMFEAQVRLIRDAYQIQPGEIDLPMLPIFALFNPALGMTTVVPELDPSRPAQVDPARIVQAIQQEGVTNSFGSPTLWLKIARYCEAHQLTLPSLRRVLCAGAPVPPALWQVMTTVMPHGELHSPYGATEALPVATISASEVREGATRATLAGAGTCVGRPLAANAVRILRLTDAPITAWSPALELPPGEIGEIVVAGPTVTTAYDQLPEATQRAKLPAPPGTVGGVFHRLGDCGYLDASGRLWFCGRAAERVETATGPLYPEQVEPWFNAQPQVRRSALIGVGAAGAREPALVVEPAEPRVLRSAAARAQLAQDLRASAAGHAYAARVRRFYFHPHLPVDVRHNAKIHRLTLSRWAATARAVEIGTPPPGTP